MPTVMTGRTSIARTNTLAVIIAGVWIDWATWSETGKFWNDAGDWSGTIYTNNRAYVGQTWAGLWSQTWDSLGSQTWNDQYTGVPPTIYTWRTII